MRAKIISTRDHSTDIRLYDYVGNEVIMTFDADDPLNDYFVQVVSIVGTGDAKVVEGQIIKSMDQSRYPIGSSITIPIGKSSEPKMGKVMPQGMNTKDLFEEGYTDLSAIRIHMLAHLKSRDRYDCSAMPNDMVTYLRRQNIFSDKITDREARKTVRKTISTFPDVFRQVRNGKIFIQTRAATEDYNRRQPSIVQTTDVGNFTGNMPEPRRIMRRYIRLDKIVEGIKALVESGLFGDVVIITGKEESK